MDRLRESLSHGRTSVQCSLHNRLTSVAVSVSPGPRPSAAGGGLQGVEAGSVQRKWFSRSDRAVRLAVLLAPSNAVQTPADFKGGVMCAGSSSAPLEEHRLRAAPPAEPSSPG
ncbi:unnamed protein product [Boreogadus saida]